MMRVTIVGGGAAGVLAAAHLRRSKPEAQITLIDAWVVPAPARRMARKTPATCSTFRCPGCLHGQTIPITSAVGSTKEPSRPTRVSPRVSRSPISARTTRRRRRPDRSRRGVGWSPGRPRDVYSKMDVPCRPTPSCSRRPPRRWHAGIVERAFGPVLDAATDGKIVVDPWAPGALAALAARRPSDVLVIGSGLTGVDVGLHLIARGATVTLLSRHGELPRRFRATGAPTDLPHVDALASEVSLDECAPRLPRISLTHAPPRRIGVR